MGFAVRARKSPWCRTRSIGAAREYRSRAALDPKPLHATVTVSPYAASRAPPTDATRGLRDSACTPPHPPVEDIRKEFSMNKDQVAGRAEDLKGKIKEGVGNVTDSERLKREGQLDQASGKSQAGLGDAKETVKDGVNKTVDKI